MKVKICGITSVDDAAEAVAAGTDMVGLMFIPTSPRVITVETAYAIERSLPPHVLRVGVFADPEPDAVFVAVRQCGLNLLQFHGNESPEFCRQFGLMVMKAFRMKGPETLDLIAPYDVDALLLDSYVPGQAGGTGHTFNWDLAVEAQRFGKPIFLAGGLTAANVADAVRHVKPFAVDVSSGVESAPGRKDPQKMRDFIAAVRGA